MKKTKKLQIGVIGSAGNDDYQNSQGANEQMLAMAEKVGRLLAKSGAIIVTGGKDGVMEAAAKGAKSEGGITIGVVKGKNRFTSNSFTDIEVVSGMIADGMDELTLVLMCDALIMIGGGAGTLQEVAIAYRNNKPVIALEKSGAWAEKLANNYLDSRKRILIKAAKSPEEAVNSILSEINSN